MRALGKGAKRKRERETERDRERQRDRETERQRDRETERERDRETERETERQTERERKVEGRRGWIHTKTIQMYTYTYTDTNTGTDTDTGLLSTPIRSRCLCLARQGWFGKGLPPPPTSASHPDGHAMSQQRFNVSKSETTRGGAKLEGEGLAQATEFTRPRTGTRTHTDTHSTTNLLGCALLLVCL